MVSRGPFKSGDIEPPKPKPKAPGGAGGRPVKTGTPQTKKRTTKPKGMGAIQLFQKHHGFAAMAAKLLNDSATQLAVEASKVRDSRSLTKAQKVELEATVIHSLAALNPDIELTQDLVYDVLKADESTFSTEKCQRIVALYQDGLADATTKEQRVDLMCNAFAAINADLLEDNDEENSTMVGDS